MTIWAAVWLLAWPAALFAKFDPGEASIIAAGLSFLGALSVAFIQTRRPGKQGPPRLEPVEELAAQASVIAGLQKENRDLQRSLNRARAENRRLKKEAEAADRGSGAA